MKCTNCGGKNFFEVDIIADYVLKTEGYVEQTVESFACENCGHVELFVSKEVIEAYKKDIRVEKEKQIEIEKMQKDIADMEQEIAKLESIISDENQTVKTVKKAEEQLDIMENKLQTLKDKLDWLNEQDID